MSETYEYILSMEHITKIYKNGFMANKHVNLSIRPGEIHGLVGENGAGKSTLMKVLFGQEMPEEGRILLKGKEIQIQSPLTALRYGIGMVHQHFMLVPSLTVAENIVFGIEPTKYGFLDYKKAIKMTEEVSKKYGLPIDPEMKIRDLSVGQKQRVEILKILLRNVEILILDEPTAVLTPQETQELFIQLKKLREHGYTIVFISHKLNEIKEICNRITVLRDGRSINTVDVDDVSESDISMMMVGRNAVKTLNKASSQPKGVVLSVRHLNYINSFEKHVLNDVSFDVRAGEILGVAGIEGNGQRELSEIVTRLDELQSGTVTIDGRSIEGKSVREIRDMKTSHISEDRMTYGAVDTATIEENIISDRFFKSDYCRHSFINNRKVKQLTEKLISEFLIKCDGPDALVKTLSGGNIQKVVAAREFTSAPKLIIVNQPTRGIDVGASELIRKKIIELRDRESAVLLISADISELLEVSDSLIVLRGGKIVAYFKDVNTVTENELGEYMLSLKVQTPEEIGGVIHG